MQDINGNVLSVTGTQTKNGKTRYDIAVSDGLTYVTFDAATASKASQFVGQQATIRVNVVQKGQYTNRYFEDVAPAGGLPAQAFPLTAGTPIAATAPFPPPGVILPTPAVPVPIPVTPYVASKDGMSPEREQKIVKQSSFATAAHLVGHVFAGAGPEALPEAEGHVLRIAKILFREVMGVAAAAAVATPTPIVQPTTPQEMADVVNAELGSNLVTVGGETHVAGSSVNKIQDNGSVIPWD